MSNSEEILTSCEINEQLDNVSSESDEKLDKKNESTQDEEHNQKKTLLARSNTATMDSPKLAGLGQRKNTSFEHNMIKPLKKSSIPCAIANKSTYSDQMKSKLVIPPKPAATPPCKSRPPSRMEPVAKGINRQQGSFESRSPQRCNSTKTSTSTLGTKCPKTKEVTSLDVKNTVKSKELQYNVKLRRLISMKKELIEKQKPIIDCYKMLVTLRNNIWDISKKKMPIENLNIIEVNPENLIAEPKVIAPDKEKIGQIRAQIREIPQNCIKLCRDVLDKRTVLIDNIFSDQTLSPDELANKINQFKIDVKTIEHNLEKLFRKHQDDIENMLINCQELVDNDNSKQIMQKKLQEADHKLEQSIGELTFEKNKQMKDREKIREHELEITKCKEKISALVKELEDEKKKIILQRERTEQLETKTKNLRHKIRETESQKSEAEKEAELTILNYKKLEESIRVKEVFFENKAKELERKNKAQVEIINKMEKERQSVDARLKEKDGQLDEKIEVYKQKILQLEDKIKEMGEREEKLKEEKTDAENQHKMVISQMTAKDEIVQDYFEIAKCKEHKPDNNVMLWSELQKVTAELNDTKEKLNLYSKEKARFIEIFTKDNEKANILELTERLFQREQRISKLTLENAQLESSLNLYKENKSMPVTTHQGLAINFSTDREENKKIEQYRIKLNDANKINNELEAKLLELKNKFDKAEQQLVDKTRFIDMNIGMLEIIHMKKRTLLREKEILETYSNEIKKKFQSLQEKYNTQDEKMNIMQERVKKQEEELGASNKKITEFEQLYQKATKKKYDLQQTIDHLQRQLVEEKAKLDKTNYRFLGLQDKEINKRKSDDSFDDR